MSKFIPNAYQTPNFYLDNYLGKLTPEEWSVLSYAIRRIFGFNKESDHISLSQFSNGIEGKDYGTGLSRETCKKCLDNVVRYNLLMKSETKSKKGTLWSLQMDSELVNNDLIEKDYQQRKGVNRKRGLKLRNADRSMAQTDNQSMAQTDNKQLDKQINFVCEAENENQENQNMAASPDNGRKLKTKKPSKRKRNPIYEVSELLLKLEPSMSIGFTRKIVKELLANGHSEDHIVGCAKWLQSKQWWIDNNIKISPNQIQRYIKEYVDIGSKEFDQHGNLITYLPDGTKMLILKSEIQQKSNTVIVESENKPTYIDVKE